jgi:excisionase family DNA binding protein
LFPGCHDVSLLLYPSLADTHVSVRPADWGSTTAHCGPAGARASTLPSRRLAGTMADSTGTSQPGLSIHEAAVMLGVSPNTVRRWAAAGRLRSERIPRPQGDVIRVFLDQMPGEVPKHVPPGEVPRDVATEVPPTFQTQVPVEQGRAEAMAALISASIAPVLAPLVAQLEAHRQTVERQADQLVSQAETIGGLRARVTTLEAENATLAARTAAQAPGSSLGGSHPAAGGAPGASTAGSCCWCWWRYPRGC